MDRILVENIRQQRAERYLLGKMSEQEAIAFEAEYFADDRVFEEVADVESDLLDAYSRGDLSPAERQQLETGYLTSNSRRKNLEFARTLAAQVSAAQMNPMQTRPVVQSRGSALISLFAPGWPMRAPIAAAVLAMIAGLSWMVVLNQRLRRQLDDMRAQQAELSRTLEQMTQRSNPVVGTPENPSGQPQLSPVQPPGPEVISLALTPGLVRSTGEVKQLVVPAGAASVHLDLYLESDDYALYKAVVETSDGNKVWRKDGLRSYQASRGGRAVALEIPSNILPRGDYLVKLSARAANGQIEDVADYRFGVVHK